MGAAYRHSYLRKPKCIQGSAPAKRIRRAVFLRCAIAFGGSKKCEDSQTRPAENPGVHYPYVTGRSSLFGCVLHARIAKSFFRPEALIGSIIYPQGFWWSARSFPYPGHSGPSSPNLKSPCVWNERKTLRVPAHGTRCIVAGLVGATFHGRAAKSVSTLRMSHSSG